MAERPEDEGRTVNWLMDGYTDDWEEEEDVNRTSEDSNTSPASWIEYEPPAPAPPPPPPPPMSAVFKRAAKAALKKVKLEKYMKAHATRSAPVDPPPCPVGLMQFPGSGMSAFQAAVQAAVHQKEVAQKLKERREQMEAAEKVPEAPVPDKMQCSIELKQMVNDNIPPPPGPPPPISYLLAGTNRFQSAIKGVINAKRFHKALLDRRREVEAQEKEARRQASKQSLNQREVTSQVTQRALPHMKEATITKRTPATQPNQTGTMCMPREDRPMTFMDESDLKDALHISLGKLLRKYSSAQQASAITGNDLTHFEGLGKFLQELRNDNLLIDVVVTVGKNTFNAHSVVLGSQSDVLKSHLLAKSHPVIPQRLTVGEGVTPYAFQVILDFMYTGDLAVTDKNVVELMTASVCLRMPTVERECRSLLRALGPESLLLVWNSAETHGLKDLMQTISQIVAREFLHVVPTNSFLHLPLERLCHLLSRDDLAVASEIQVADAGIRWINYLLAQRQIHVDRVMMCVRFPLMTPQELLSMVGRTSYIRDSLEVNLMIMKAHWYVTLQSANEPCTFVPTPSLRRCSSPTGPSIFDSPTTVAKISPDGTTANAAAVRSPTRVAMKPGMQASSAQTTYCGNCCTPTLTRQSQAPNKGTPDTAIASKNISPCGELTCPKQGTVVTAEPSLTIKQEPTNDRTKGSLTRKTPVYKENYKVKDTCEVKDALTLKVNVETTSKESDSTRDQKVGKNQPVSPLRISPRSHEGVYVIGTKTAKDPVDAKTVILELDTDQNRWHVVKSFESARVFCAAAYLNNAIYVSGGCDPAKSKDRQMLPSSDVFRLDLTNLKWNQVASMKTERCHHGFVALHGLLFALGGQDAKQQIQSSAECYNPITNTWTFVKSMHNARLGAAVTVFQGHVIVAGGFGGAPKPGKIPMMIDAVEVFNAEDKSWIQLQPLNRPRCYPRFATCQGQLNLNGGMTLNHSTPNGYNDLDSVEVYNTDTDSWTTRTHFMQGRHDFAAFCKNGKIYIAGGNTSQQKNILTSVECYDVNNDMWELGVADLPYSLLGPISVICH